MRDRCTRRGELLASALAVFLAACGGGGGMGGAAESGGNGDADAASLDPKSSFSADDAMHFLTRTQFGVRDAELAKLQSMGMPDYIEEMLANRTADDPALEAEALTEIANPDFPRQEELVRWWLHLLVRTKNPFREMLALFWHDHFATSQLVLTDTRRRWMMDQVNLLRSASAGNVRDLLYEISIDPAMLVWLNGVDSQRGSPNLNYAREFYELFSLGANHGYTERDVGETARAFTGFRVRYDPKSDREVVVWDEQRHDDGSKIIFDASLPGRSGPEGYLEFQDVVDHELAHRAVGSWICRGLFEYFCYENPPDSVLADLAQTLRDSGWSIEPVLRTLFLSRAFYSRTSRQGFIKSPIEFGIGFIRSTGLEIEIADLDWSLAEAGQRITMPPGVNGWPGGAMWLTEQAMVGRANLLRLCIAERDYQEGLGIDLDDLLPPPERRTAEHVVTSLARLLRIDWGADERQACVDYLNFDRVTTDDGKERTIPDPFDGNASEQIDKKVRGLLYILAQHPSYQLR